MAKKKGSNIQRKNMQMKAPVIHPTIGNPQNSPVTEPTAFVASYNFTMAGMFVGLLLGYFINKLALGFAIGLLAGALVDMIINLRKKKIMEKKFGTSIENSTDKL